MDLQNKIEDTFRFSSDNDELFDAFNLGLNSNLKSPEPFKILLANPALNDDEIFMYTEKLANVYKENAFDIYLWSARICGNKIEGYQCVENAINLILKASDKKPNSEEPYIQLLELYNYDENFPTNEIILEIVEKSIEKVIKKSRVYYGIANVYRTIGKENLEHKYKKLAEEAIKYENQ